MEAVKLVTAALADPDPARKELAVMVLAELRDPEARRQFAESTGHSDPTVRQVVVARLAADGPSAHRGALLGATRDPDWLVREAAWEGLVGDRDPATLARASEAVDERIAGGGGRYGRSPLLEAEVLAAGADPAGLAAVRRASAGCTPWPGDPAGVQVCGVLAAARWALGDETARDDVRRALAHDAAYVRNVVLRALRFVGSDDAHALLRSALSDASPQARWAAANALRLTGARDTATLEALRRAAAGDPDDTTRAEAARALPTDDPASTAALAACLDGVGQPFDVELAAELARRGHPGGVARLTERAKSTDRWPGRPARRLVEGYPLVAAIASVPGPAADDLLRLLRDRRGAEALVAAFALARRGHRQVPAWVEDAAAGRNGADAQLLAIAVNDAAASL
jgi:hypothetical protein